MLSVIIVVSASVTVLMNAFDELWGYVSTRCFDCNKPKPEDDSEWQWEPFLLCAECRKQRLIEN